MNHAQILLTEFRDFILDKDIDFEDYSALLTHEKYELKQEFCDYAGYDYDIVTMVVDC